MQQKNIHNIRMRSTITLAGLGGGPDGAKMLTVFTLGKEGVIKF